MNSWKILAVGLVLVYTIHTVTADESVQKEPILQPNGEKIACGTKWKSNGRMYRIFKGPNQLKDDTKDTSSSSKHPVYEYCMDEDTLLVMYANYKLDNPSILKPFLPEEEQSSEESSPYDRQYSDKSIALDRQESNVSGAVSYERQESTSAYLSRYEKPVSDAQKETIISEIKKYFKKSAAFKAQFVVIPDFIPGEDSRREQMYSYDISAAMNAELVEPWRRLILEIRSKLSQIYEPINVYSGIYETYRLHGIRKFMNKEENKLPIPFAWWILLYNDEQTKGFSVIMQNNAFSPNEEKVPAMCEENDICQEIGLQIPKYSRALMYCCPASTITDRYAFTDKKIENYWTIESEGDVSM